jgi:hypothetical protein
MNSVGFILFMAAELRKSEPKSNRLSGVARAGHLLPSWISLFQIHERNRKCPPAPRKIGVKLTRLSKKQADYLGVPIEGPYRLGHYRY